MKYIFLYAGDIPDSLEYESCDIVGLSIKKSDSRHIKHDITKPYHLPDNSVDAFQAEDVFEHISYDKLTDSINEIYRILKPGGYFRLSVPDYRCDVLYNRSLKDENGEIYFDPFGGGKFKHGVVTGGGHLWFPVYEKVLKLIENSNFVKYTFYHYYNCEGEPITHIIDYSKGFVMRTPDHDDRVADPYRPMSIVVDMFK